jgi:hypothetical protein
MPSFWKLVGENIELVNLRLLANRSPLFAFSIKDAATF